MQVSLSLSLSLLIFLSSCSPQDMWREQVGTDSFSPHVTLPGGGEVIEPVSYSANVEVYSSVSNRAEAPKLQTKYRIAVKLIDGVLNTRMDFPGDAFPDGKPRMVLGVGNQLRIIDATSLEVQGRANLDDDVNLKTILDRIELRPSLSGFAGRVDGVAMRSAFRQLSFDLQETENKGVIAQLPVSLLEQLNKPGYTYKSAKIYYDGTVENMAGTDIEMYDSVSDVNLIITIRPVYEEYEGTLIKVAEVVETTFDYPYINEVPEGITPIPNSIEDIPELTEAQLEDLIENGDLVSEIEDMPIGDLANPDYKQTEITMYQNIEVNLVSDSYFRVIGIKE